MSFRDYCSSCGASYTYDGIELNIDYSDKSYSPRDLIDIPDPVKIDTFEDCYWKYVKSDTSEDAIYWFNQMISKVTMELQPAGKDWSSWVADSESKDNDKIPILGHLGSISAAIVVMTMLTVAIIIMMLI